MEHGCCICREHRGLYSPAEIHHTSGKDNHLDTLPLCFYDHREGSSRAGYVSRHPHKAQFEARYGTEQELLDKLRLEIGDYE